MDWTIPLQAAIQKIKVGDYQSALADLEYTLQLSPTNATAFKWRGFVRYHIGLYYDAIADLNMAIQFADQQSSSVLRHRAEAKKMIGHYESAKDDLMLALRLKNNHKTYQSLGDVNKMLGRYDEALLNLNVADQLHPNDPFTLTVRGEVKMMLELFVEALVDLNRALSIKGDDIHALCVRAELSKCMKMYNEALLDLDIAAALDPDNQCIISLRNEVRSMIPPIVAVTAFPALIPHNANELIALHDNMADLVTTNLVPNEVIEEGLFTVDQQQNNTDSTDDSAEQAEKKEK